MNFEPETLELSLVCSGEDLIIILMTCSNNIWFILQLTSHAQLVSPFDDDIPLVLQTLFDSWKGYSSFGYSLSLQEVHCIFV